MSLKDRLSDDACWDLFSQFPHGNLAGNTQDGIPVLRTLNHALFDGAVYFHGASRGEKRGLIGQQVVFGCEEVVAQIPSHWRDSPLACPATTWFRSAQAHGPLEVVEDPELKAHAMASLMDRLQPEGGFIPITPGSADYKKTLRATAVFRLVPERLTGRLKIGQNNQPDDLQTILRSLWGRGTDQDLRAIETVVGGNPRALRPPFLLAPMGIELLTHPSPELAREAARLLEPLYWNVPYDAEQLALVQRQASAWIGARDPKSGRLVGTAAAQSDGVKKAFVFDVALDPAYQGCGLGTAIMETLLDHPRVRGTRTVRLGTRDAHDFYRRLGFVEQHEAPNPLGVSTMVRGG